MQRELGDVLPEVDDGQQHHRNGTAGGCGDSSTLDTQLWTAPVTEDESVVAYDVQHVDDTSYHHRIDDLVGTAQRGRERQRQRLEERQRTRQSQVHQSVAHQLRAQAHQL